MLVQTDPTPSAPLQADAAPVLALAGVTKTFPGVKALSAVSLELYPGRVTALVGENGAGKSTLMSILYGFYKADAGEIFISGNRTEIPDSQAAIAAGIGMVFQHFKLVENFTVLENIILGAEDGGFLKPSLAKARKTLVDLAAEYELNVDPDALIEEIGVGMQQRVEILKALYRQADILILDEATSSIDPETEAVIQYAIEKLIAKRTSIIIAHRLTTIRHADQILNEELIFFQFIIGKLVTRDK